MDPIIFWMGIVLITLVAGFISACLAKYPCMAEKTLLITFCLLTIEFLACFAYLLERVTTQ